MTVSQAKAEWTGSLESGKGTLEGASTHLRAPFSYATRFEGASGGTTPEELLGAALAGCFSMFLAAQLDKAGHTPTRITTRATVHLESGPLLAKIELETTALVPGVEKALFDEKVAFAKANCPVSKALGAVPSITVKATLEG